MPTTAQAIGLRLKQEREATGKSQTEFASIAGTTKKSQIDYEQGKRQPKSMYFSAIFEANLGIDIYYIITGQPGPTLETQPTIDHVLKYLPEPERSAIKTIIESISANN